MKILVEIDLHNTTQEEFEKDRAMYFTTDDPTLISLDNAYMRKDPTDNSFYLFKFVSVVPE